MSVTDSQHKDYSRIQDPQVCVSDKVCAGAPGTGRVADDSEQAQYRERPAKEQAMIEAEERRRRGHARKHDWGASPERKRHQSQSDSEDSSREEMARGSSVEAHVLDSQRRPSSMPRISDTCSIGDNQEATSGGGQAKRL